MNFPRILKVGLISLWISICFQSLSVFIISSTLYYIESDLFSNIIIALPSMFLAFLAYKISCGRNWARVTFLILFLVLIFPNGLIKSVFFALALFDGQLTGVDWHYQLVFILIAIALLLQVFSLCVFFSKPSSLYFRQSKRDL